MIQLGFYFDQSRCIGCASSLIARKDWNDVPAGPASWRSLLTIERGTYPDPLVTFLSTACYCVLPSCVPACPTGAIHEREEDGIFIVTSEECTGNESGGLCEQNCIAMGLHSSERRRTLRRKNGISAAATRCWSS